MECTKRHPNVCVHASINSNLQVKLKYIVSKVNYKASFVTELGIL